MANDIRELNANIRLRTSQKTANVVADAVIVEPVSAPKFPANREINREFFDFGLALQLRSPFYVGSAGFGLMCASPEGPCDDLGGPDASLRKTNSDAPDFLN